MACPDKEKTRAYSADYYASHREERLVFDAVYRAAHREERRAQSAAHYAAHGVENRQEQAKFLEWLQILRTLNGCEDCGVHDGRLEHHHVDPGTKKYSISQMSTCSLDALEDELEKCVVLCRSRHKMRHDAMRALAS